MPSSDLPKPELRRAGLPRAVLDLCERLTQAGQRTWIVGGCVRDSLLSQLEARTAPGTWVAKDWDIATDAEPERVMQLFRRVIPTGIEHGTVTVILQDVSLEVTTLRAEKSYGDGRRPDHVDFVRSIEEDLARRDFTVNAIAFEPHTEAVVDPFAGLADLRAHRLSAVGEPERRFAEDGLRVLRAARFVATLEFELDGATAAAIRPSLDTYRRVSAERIRDEWQKTLNARAPSRGFAVMLEHGLLEITAPELAVLAGRRTAAGDDVLTHSLRRMDRCARRPELRLAALLRDLDDDSDRAAAAADALLARLRYSNAERKWITRLIAARALPIEPQRSDADVRRWLRRIGVDLLGDVCSIARADAQALQSSGEQQKEMLGAIDTLERRAQTILSDKPPLSLGDLAIDGKQLMARAGMRPGPQIGRTLEALLDAVIDEPAANTPDRLLQRALELVAADAGKSSR